MAQRWVFYQDKQGDWIWKRKASTGRVIEAATLAMPTLEESQEDARVNGWTEDAHTLVHPSLHKENP